MRLYLGILGSAVVLLSFGYLISVLFLYNGRELQSVSEIVGRQSIDGGLYSGWAASPIEYKFAAYAARKPEVLVLGSSRAMQFSQWQFKVPVYTMGGVVYTPIQALTALRRAAELHRPRMVIYAMDYWQFCATGRQEDEEPRLSALSLRWPGWHGAINRVVLPWKLLKEDRISLPDLISILLAEAPTKVNGVELYGLGSLRTQSGFASDGSFQYAAVSNPVKWWESRVSTAIDNAAYYFPAHCRLHRGNLGILRRLGEEARKLQINLVLVAAPLPPTSVDLLRARPGHFDYADAWVDALVQSTDLTAYMVLDGRKIGSSDAEFYDEFHGGPVTYARLMLHLAEVSPAIAAVTDVDNLRTQIEAFGGRPAIPYSDLFKSTFPVTATGSR